MLRKTAQIMLLVFLATVGSVGLGGSPSATAAERDYNKCVSWGKSSGQVRNGCKNKLNIWWQDVGDCKSGDCMITVQGGASYTSGHERIVKFLACAAPAEPLKAKNGGRACLRAGSEASSQGAGKPKSAGRSYAACSAQKEQCQRQCSGDVHFKQLCRNKCLQNSFICQGKGPNDSLDMVSRELAANLGVDWDTFGGGSRKKTQSERREASSGKGRALKAGEVRVAGCTGPMQEGDSNQLACNRKCDELRIRGDTHHYVHENSTYWRCFTDRSLVR